MSNGRRKNLLAAEDGQALVEFAISLLVHLALWLGVIQLCLVFVAKEVVNYAAFAACRAELVGEDPQHAAEMICAPISHGAEIPGRPKSTITDLPGWGELNNSDLAGSKAQVEVLTPVTATQPEVKIRLTFFYELMFALPGIYDVIGDAMGFEYINGAWHARLTKEIALSKPWQRELESAQGHPQIPEFQ